MNLLFVDGRQSGLDQARMMVDSWNTDKEYFSQSYEIRFRDSSIKKRTFLDDIGGSAMFEKYPQLFADFVGSSKEAIERLASTKYDMVLTTMFLPYGQKCVPREVAQDLDVLLDSALAYFAGLVKDASPEAKAYVTDVFRSVDNWKVDSRDVAGEELLPLGLQLAAMYARHPETMFVLNPAQNFDTHSGDISEAWYYQERKKLGKESIDNLAVSGSLARLYLNLLRDEGKDCLEKSKVYDAHFPSRIPTEWLKNKPTYWTSSLKDGFDLLAKKS